MKLAAARSGERSDHLFGGLLLVPLDFVGGMYESSQIAADFAQTRGAEIKVLPVIR